MASVATDAAESRSDEVTVITAAPRWPRPKVRQAWRRRELLLFFTLRDLKVRYAQTVLGWAWTIIQPIGLTLAFTLAFRKIGNVTTGAIPYALFAFAGLTFWTFFARAVTQSADSLVTNASLLTKTAAPRLLMPVYPIVSALADFALVFVMLLTYSAASGHVPDWRIVFAPAAVALGATLALGIGLILSSINVRYRDIRQALPFAVQILLFLTPVAYPLSQLGGTLEDVLAANPLVGIVELFRWSVLGTEAPGAVELAIALAVPPVLVAVGSLYFARVERLFADVA